MSSTPWELRVEDDAFARIQGGYSGGPVTDGQGRVVAVATHREGDKQGYALCISNLWRLEPAGGGTIADLLPGFPPPGTDGRCERIRRALADPRRAAGVAAIRAEIESDLSTLAARPDLSPADQARLTLLDLYASGTLPPEQFLAIWRSQTPQPQVAPNGLDYPRLAERLRNGQVALFLGADLAPLCGLAVPRVAALPGRVAGALAIGYGPFDKGRSEVCEYVQLDPDGQGRRKLAATLDALVSTANSPGDGACPDLCGLLAGLEVPLVILSAAYTTRPPRPCVS